MNDERLIEAAREARDEEAYAWRSDFQVGVALELEHGATVTGANVEVHGMIPSVHAEMMAFFKAVTEFGPEYVRRNARTVAVSTIDEGGHVPCALCLHTMSEFVDDVRILADTGDISNPIETTLDDQYVDAYRPGDHD